jgi:putative protein kinase ArgK-like GTPase of G3E family
MKNFKNFIKKLSDGGLAEDTYAFMERALDENDSKEKMVNKQEFIEKAWRWLKEHIKIETISYNDVWDISIVEILAADFTTVDEMEESFRKTMEE